MSFTSYTNSTNPTFGPNEFVCFSRLDLHGTGVIIQICTVARRRWSGTAESSMDLAFG